MAQPQSRLTALPGRPGPEALIGVLPIALILLDPEGCIVQVNAAAEMLLNAGANSLTHKPLGVVLRLDDACRAGLRGDTSFVAYGTTVERPRGGKLQVDFHASALPDHPEWRLLTLSLAPTAPVMRERRSGALAATGAATLLAHEIKNPLAGIRGAAQLLDGSVGEEGRTLTRLIRDEVDRVASLIDRMEAFTDLRPLKPVPENIHAILDHVRTLAASGFGERLDIRDAFDPSLPPVQVDRDAMIQVVLNLLKNAAEAVPNGRRGTAWLTTGYRHGVAVPAEKGRRRALPIELCVIDDGPGPPADLAEHLFEPFVTSKASGRGLGLALVDKLVRDQGGIIQFSREGDPERTVFRLLLPRAR